MRNINEKLAYGLDAYEVLADYYLVYEFDRKFKVRGSRYKIFTIIIRENGVSIIGGLHG